MAASMPSNNPMAPVTPPPEQQTFGIPAPQIQSSLKRKAVDDSILPDNVKHHQAGPSAIIQPGPDGQYDPKQVAMASRIAAFYEGKARVEAARQQQKCKAWAATYQQKARFIMMASILVVAWHVRDRILRRRRRKNRKFRKALEARCSKSGGISTSERVRRWAKKVPDTTISPDLVASPGIADAEEAAFKMDQESPSDKDTDLLRMANGMIKSHAKEINVPLFGVLSLEESDAESESEVDDDDDDDDDEEEDEDDVEHDDEKSMEDCDRILRSASVGQVADADIGTFLTDRGITL